MTGDVVNLRQRRKRQARAARDAVAAENRTRFGQTGAAKQRARMEDDRETRSHEGHRLAPTPKPTATPDSET